MDLDTCRKSIDQIDEEILSLFAKRARVAIQVAHLKKEKKIPVLDKKREEEVLKKIEMLSKKNHLDPSVMRAIFVLFIAYCRSLEENVSS